MRRAELRIRGAVIGLETVCLFLERDHQSCVIFHLKCHITLANMNIDRRPCVKLKQLEQKTALWKLSLLPHHSMFWPLRLLIRWVTASSIGFFSFGRTSRLDCLAIDWILEVSWALLRLFASYIDWICLGSGINCWLFILLFALSYLTEFAYITVGFCCCRNKVLQPLAKQLLLRLKKLSATRENLWSRMHQEL